MTSGIQAHSLRGASLDPSSRVRHFWSFTAQQQRRCPGQVSSKPTLTVSFVSFQDKATAPMSSPGTRPALETSTRQSSQSRFWMRRHDGGSIGDGVAGRGFEIVFVELVAEGANADAEKFCRVGAITLAAFQGGEDVAFLYLAEAAEFADAVFAGAGDLRRLGGEPQVRQLQHPAVTAEDHGPLDHILQFADVAGPGMTLERRQALIGNTMNLHAMLAGKALAELIGKQRDVLFAVPQRRNHDRHDV